MHQVLQELYQLGFQLNKYHMRKGFLNQKQSPSAKKRENPPISPTRQREFAPEGNEGLPNVGFTCFLNSVIQMLYSATKFKNRVIELRGKHRFINALADIFEDMMEKKPYFTKMGHLQTFTKLLRSLDQGYQKNTEQDSLQFLLLILNELDSIDDSLLAFFKFTYESVCGCKNSQLIFEETSLNYKPNFCVKCRQLLRLQIQDPSQYLICLCSKQQTERDEEKSYNEKDPIKYKHISSVLYEGDGQTGHYIAERKIGDKFYCFNDLWVSQSFNWGQPLIMLYQKVQNQPSRAVQIEKKEQTRLEIVENQNTPADQNTKTDQNMKMMPCGHEMNTKLLNRKLANIAKSKNFTQFKCIKRDCQVVWQWEQIKLIANPEKSVEEEFDKYFGEKKKLEQKVMKKIDKNEKKAEEIANKKEQTKLKSQEIDYQKVKTVKINKVSEQKEAKIDENKQKTSKIKKVSEQKEAKIDENKQKTAKIKEVSEQKEAKIDETIQKTAQIGVNEEQHKISYQIGMKTDDKERQTYEQGSKYDGIKIKSDQKEEQGTANKIEVQAEKSEQKNCRADKTQEKADNIERIAEQNQVGLLGEKKENAIDENSFKIDQPNKSIERDNILQGASQIILQQISFKQQDTTFYSELNNSILNSSSKKVEDQYKLKANKFCKTVFSIIGKSAMKLLTNHCNAINESKKKIATTLIDKAREKQNQAITRWWNLTAIAKKEKLLANAAEIILKAIKYNTDLMFLNHAEIKNKQSSINKMLMVHEKLSLKSSLNKWKSVNNEFKSKESAKIQSTMLFIKLLDRNYQKRIRNTIKICKNYNTKMQELRKEMNKKKQLQKNKSNNQTTQGLMCIGKGYEKKSESLMKSKVQEMRKSAYKINPETKTENASLKINSYLQQKIKENTKLQVSFHQQKKVKKDISIDAMRLSLTIDTQSKLNSEGFDLKLKNIVLRNGIDNKVKYQICGQNYFPLTGSHCISVNYCSGNSSIDVGVARQFLTNKEASSDGQHCIYITNKKEVFVCGKLGTNMYNSTINPKDILKIYVNHEENSIVFEINGKKYYQCALPEQLINQRLYPLIRMKEKGAKVQLINDK